MTDNNAPADDVVASLREVERFYSTMHEQSGVAKVAAKAAAEIERLRADKERLLQALRETEFALARCAATWTPARSYTDGK